MNERYQKEIKLNTLDYIWIANLHKRNMQFKKSN